MARTYFRYAVRDDGETDIMVEYSCSGGELPSWDDPGSGPEVEIVDAWNRADENMVNAPRITLTDAEDQRICIEIAENPPEDDGPDPDDERDRRRDDEMMDRLK